MLEEILLTIIIGLLGIIFYFIKRPEKVKLLRSTILYFFAIWDIKKRKQAVKEILNAKVNDIFSKLSKTYEEFKYYQNVEIKLIEPDNFSESYLDDNEAVVFVNYTRNTDKLFVDAWLEYIELATYQQVKRFFHNETRNALFNYTAKYTLNKTKEKKLLSFFNNNIENNLKGITKQYYDYLENIGSKGYFEAIFLKEIENELLKYPLSASIPINAKNDINELIIFLYNIAIKRKDENAELNKKLNLFNIGIIIIGKKDVRDTFGTTPYIKRIEKNIYEEENRSIYLIGWRNRKDFIDEILKKLLSIEDLANLIRIDRSSEHFIRISEGEIYCVHLHIEYSDKDI